MEISSMKALPYFDTSAETTLQMDASKKGLGACLIQNGKVVCYASRALTKTEQNYQNLEREALGTIWGMEKFHYFLYGKEFTLEPDQKPLVSIYKKHLVDISPRVQRLIVRSFPYQPFTVVYKKGKDIPVADALSRVTPMDPEDNIKLPIIAVNLITKHILMSTPSQDSFSRKLDRLRKSTAQDNQLTRLSHYINTGFPCEKKNLPIDLQDYWNYRETLSIKLNTTRMITIQHLMSEHCYDSISNKSAQPEENTTQKKYLTRLLDHINIDLPCDKESSPADLPESWSHKELLHNTYKLINHGNQIIPVIHREFHILSRPLKTMAHQCRHTEKEVHLLSGPSELQPVTIALPHNDHGIITQYTPREKAQDLPLLPDIGHPQPPDASEAQKFKDSAQVRNPTTEYSHSTENQKAKFHSPYILNEERNHVRYNSVNEIPSDLVIQTKSNAASVSDSVFSERKEENAEMAEIAEDAPAEEPAPVPAPAPTLETVQE